MTDADRDAADAAIVSKRLELRSLTTAFHEALLDGDRSRAAALIDARIPDGWPARDDRRRLRHWLALLRADPARGPWLTRAMVLRADRELVGRIGFHDRPGAVALDAIAPGAVEFGYEVFEPHRRRGYATEAAAAMMDWAQRRHGVTRFIASVSPSNAASLAVIAKFGFARIGSRIDEIDGSEDIFERRLDSCPSPPSGGEGLG